MARCNLLYVIFAIILLTVQQANAQELQQQQQQVPAINIEKKAPTAQQHVEEPQQQHLANNAQQAQTANNNEEAVAAASESNKAYVVPAVAGKLATDARDTKNVVVISEKTLSEHQAAQAAAQSQSADVAKAAAPVESESANTADTKTAGTADNTNKLPHENPDKDVQANNNLMKIKNKLGLYTEIDDDSYKTASFFFLAISSIAILFVAFKIYRMRLSRAERKYGVQGNRAAQELTPLPMAIDDGNGNSDDEDQTLFDRHQIRIL